MKKFIALVVIFASILSGCKKDNVNPVKKNEPETYDLSAYVRFKVSVYDGDGYNYVYIKKSDFQDLYLNKYTIMLLAKDPNTNIKFDIKEKIVYCTNATKYQSGNVCIYETALDKGQFYYNLILKRDISKDYYYLRPEWGPDKAPY